MVAMLRFQRGNSVWLAPASFVSWFSERGYTRRPTLAGDATVTAPVQVLRDQPFVLAAPADAEVSPPSSVLLSVSAGADESTKPRKRRR